jgi:hypothetical protein
MKRPVPVESASAFIDEKIRELGDWRGKTLAKVRKIIHQADPEIVEEWKWMGTPVWSHAGIVCTGETYKKASASPARLSFSKGVVLRYRIHLESQHLAPGAIHLRLGAVRRLTYEASDCGLLSPDLAAGIRRVNGERHLGCKQPHPICRERPDRHRARRLIEPVCVQVDATRQSDSPMNTRCAVDRG